MEQNDNADTSQRVLADMKICRAVDIGVAEFADCLVEKPFECEYAIPFGDGYFCKHPNRARIIENTIEKLVEY